MAKGDPLQTARIAGIMAAKRTSEIIPLCHPVAAHARGRGHRRRRRTGYRIVGRARTVGPTGVEMEALVAVSAAALTIYDMLKAVDRGMVIGPIVLAEKRGRTKWRLPPGPMTVRTRADGRSVDGRRKAGR